VVDVDDSTLAFIDREATRRGLSVRCLFADLRLGLPTAATGWADLVLTDPPYTPEGVQLFLASGARALRERASGRVVMAYGFSDRQPVLGLKVQQAALGLGMVFEAILPHFNHYQGAQAVGSASDLYVCRPTARTWRKLAAWEAPAGAVYTRGPQAVEAQAPTLEVAGLLSEPMRAAPREIAISLAADPGGWLLRALLACSAERASFLVPNDHPDLATEAGQRRLIALVESKYALRLRRSHPEPRLAVVEATLIDGAALEPRARLVRRLLSRAHGTVSNIWREGLIDLDRSLTRNQARAIIAQACSTPSALDTRLLDLPRHQLEWLLAEVAASADAVLPPG
jgi:N4-bis(aminopropyl)spermidine synthase